MQGIEYYRVHDPARSAGLLHPEIGGYRICDLQPVAAFDVDARKVGERLEDAILAAPNCTKRFAEKLPESDVIVQMGPELDGVAEHMARHPEARAFRVAHAPPVDVARVDCLPRANEKWKTRSGWVTLRASCQDCDSR